VTAVLIPLALWCIWPAMSTYRGLSGIDSALFALLAAINVKRAQAARQWWWVGALGLVCLAFAGKVTYELVTGDTLFVDSHAAQMTPVPLAHGIGAAAGVVAGLAKLPCLSRKLKIVNNLLGCPLCCRVFRHIDMYDASPLVSQNDEYEQDSACHRWHGEKIAGDDILNMMG
jgi:hypothetical protein